MAAIHRWIFLSSMSTKSPKSSTNIYTISVPESPPLDREKSQATSEPTSQPDHADAVDQTPPKHRYRYLFKFLRKDDTGLIVVAVLTTILAAVTPVASMYMVSEIFTHYTSFINGQDTAGGFVRTLGWLCLGIAMIGVVTSLLVSLQTFSYCTLSERQQVRCRKELYGTLLNRRFTWFENQTDLNGKLIQLNRSIEEFRSTIGEFLCLFLRSLITVIALLVACLIFCWRLTLLVLATAPLLGLVLFLCGRKVDFWAKKEDEITSKAASILNWNLSSYTWVKTCFSHTIEQTKFDGRLQKNAKAYSKFILFSAGASSLMRMFSLFIFVETFWFGSYLKRAGYNSSGQILSTFYGVINVANTLSCMSVMMVVLQKGMASYENILSYIAPTHHTRHNYPPLEGEIILNNVSFEYSTRKTGVYNVSMEILPKLTFLVGSSGSGKSTIACLLLKLYNINSGHIAFDGMSIDRLDPYWIRSQITLVQQFAPVFKGTIRENICLGEQVTEHKLLEIVHLTCLDSLISSLPKGLDAEIGGSFQPSGGEKQRIALARAFVRDTPVLILDESLSAVDSSQRMTLMSAIRTNRFGKTTLMITHDYTQIRDDDNVYLMSQGKITGHGTKSMLGTQFRTIKVKPSVSNNEKVTDTDQLETQPPTKERSTFKLLRRFLTRTNKLGYIVGILIATFRNVLIPTFSFCFSKLIAGIVESTSGITSKSYQTKWSLIVLGIAIADGTTFFIARLITEYYADKAVERSRSKCFDKILHQDMSWLQNCNRSEIDALVANDARDLRTLYGTSIGDATGAMALLTTGIIWATIIGWKLSLVGLSFFPLFAIVGVLASFITDRSQNRYKDTVDAAEEVCDETVENIKTIICLNLQQCFHDKFKEQLAKVNRAGVKRSLSTAVSTGITPTIASAAESVLFYYGIKLVLLEEYQLIQVTQVIMMILMSTAFSGTLFSSMATFVTGNRAASKINTLLSLEDDPDMYRGYLTPEFRLSKRQKAYQFVGVDFCYPTSSKKILNNFDLSIPRNAITCLVGQSGCGKSTVLSLLLRLYEPDSGLILLDGYDESGIKLSWLRANIAVVPQKTHFVDATIRENLLYGNPHTITDTEIFQTLAKVDMAIFVASLDHQLDTHIGGEARDLAISGGQAQRLCIARAILRRAPIMILDECTSALDPYNAKLVAELMKSLKRRCTIVMVTHSEDVMDIADKVMEIS